MGTPEVRLERVSWRDAQTGEETERTIRNVFLFIGADPATNWLRACGIGLERQRIRPNGSASGGGQRGGQWEHSRAAAARIESLRRVRGGRCKVKLCEAGGRRADGTPTAGKASACAQRKAAHAYRVLLAPLIAIGAPPIRGAKVRSYLNRACGP